MLSTPIRLAFALVITIAGAAAAQEPDPPTDALVRLQRTSCFGPCPVYTVTLDARGTVTYEGERFVRVVGRRTAQVERIHFFQMRDAYRVIENPDGTVSSVSDMPTKTVTVTANNRTKSVEDY